eukprot:100102-Rhodomonas_salina.2
MMLAAVDDAGRFSSCARACNHDSELRHGPGPGRGGAGRVPVEGCGRRRRVRRAESASALASLDQVPLLLP